MARERIAHLHGAAQALVTGAGVGVAGIDDERLHIVLQMLLGEHHRRGTETVLRKHPCDRAARREAHHQQVFTVGLAHACHRDTQVDAGNGMQ